MRKRIDLQIWLTVIFLFGSGISLASVEYSNTLIAITGQQAPGQAANFTTFYQPPQNFPILNSQGKVAFCANFEGDSRPDGVYYAEGGTVYRVADTSMKPPQDPTGYNFLRFSKVFLNDNGTIMFYANSGSVGQGTYMAGSPLVRIVSAPIFTVPGSMIPGHPGVYFGATSSYSLNDSGIVAFSGQSSSGTITGAYTADTTQINKIADNSSPVPSQPDAYFPAVASPFVGLAINSSGNVAFKANYWNGVGNYGIYIYNSGSLQKVIDEATIPPGQTEPPESLSYPSLNSSSKVAFNVSHTSYAGNYLWQGSQLDVIADSNSQFNAFGPPRINDNGEACFSAGFGDYHFNVVKVDSSGSLEVLVSLGDPVAGQPDYFYTSFGCPLINDNGNIVFYATWNGGKGIYSTVGGQITKVIDSEDILIDGEKAPELRLLYLDDFEGRKAFNDAGQVTFIAALADGREAIYLSNPVPAPYPGDITGDGKVDIDDLDRLAEDWLWIGSAGSIPEDIFEDGTVNFLDFAILASDWQEGTIP